MKDLFSNHAADYAAFRPRYPDQLFDFLASTCDERTLAWDAGTGNGQAAIELSKRFEKIIATDISLNQITQAPKHENIFYKVEAAESTTLQSNSVDLITVGQAFHWFNEPLFFKEANRVLKSNGVVALWGYGLFNIDGERNALIKNFYENVVGPYWDSERKKVDDRYSSSAFPFDELSVPSFEMKYRWTPDQLFGYLNTWSSVKKFIAANGFNPVEHLAKSLDFSNAMVEVSFPLFFRIGRKKSDK